MQLIGFSLRVSRKVSVCVYVCVCVFTLFVNLYINRTKSAKLKIKVTFHLFVLAGLYKRNSFGKFKWKGPGCAHTFFPATTLQIPALWPTGAGEPSGSDP